MSGFWPHPWSYSDHRKESPCGEKSTPHGVLSSEKKKEIFILKADKAKSFLFDLKDSENFEEHNLENLYWRTKKTPYGKKVNKRVYDADRKMFFYPRQQEVSLENSFDPLAREDVQKEDATSQQQEAIYNSNKVSSNSYNY